MEILKKITGFLLEGFLTAALLLAPMSASAALDSPTRAVEHDVKAAFIYNFTKFITWPPASFENNSTPFRACIVEDMPLIEALESLTQKSTKGRQFQVIRFGSGVEAGMCHLLFIGESTERSLAKKIIASVGNSPVLTVGDYPAFATQGGLVRFIPFDGRLTFEINLEASRRSGLEISSKLLNLAKIVRGQP